jgi:hypothetical protein
MRLRGFALGLVLTAVTLSACGTADSGFVYLNNTSERTFVKVPEGWKRYQVKKEVSKERPAPIPTTSNKWTVVFDASDKPSAGNIDQAAPTSPVGQIEISEFNADYRGDTSFHDGINISSLRQFATDFQLDPVDAVKNGNDAVELVSYSEITTKTGMRGNRMVFNWRVAPNSWVSIDQTTYLNATTSKFYRLIVKCESTCFKANRNTIDQIADSFQVRA